ncbi:MAG TPA: TIGR03986 family CRISPR-associated RAMP protein [Smithellaceae bacterium]|nr:TIGR03986 family CRISPR-associated RAMP protein [Smithellaceae bacterium]
MVKLPYGFVPVKGCGAELVVAQPFDNPEGEVYTGRMECTLRALSPLIPGNTQQTVTENGKERTDIYPLKIDGKHVISEHTLKGCIAAFVSAYLGIPMTRVNNRRYTFRPNIRPEQATIKWGYGIISNIVTNAGEIESVEVTKMEGPYGFYYNTGTVKVSDLSTSIPQTEKYYLNFGTLMKIKNTGDRSGDLCFFPYQDGLDGHGTFANTFQGQHSHHNYFAILAENYPDPAGKTPKIFTIDADTISLYNETLAALTTDEALKEHPQSNRNGFNIDRIKRNMNKKWPLEVGNIVFFEYKEGTQKILTFGKHFRYRWAYRRTVGETPSVGWVEGEFAKGKDEHGNPVSRPLLSLMREVFGYSVADDKKYRLSKEAYDRLKKDGLQKVWSAKSGKIRFNFAFYQSGGKTNGTMILPRPGSPKSTAYEFYVQQDMQNLNSPLPLNTYGDPVREDFDAGHKLSGQKMYYKDWKAGDHHTLQHDDRSQDFLVRAHGPLVPEKKGDLISFPSFKFTVHFENLTKKELQLLVFALTLGKNNHCVKETENIEDFITAIEAKEILCHQIGYGKNYGMGAIQITINRLKCFRYEEGTNSFVVDTIDEDHEIRSQMQFDKERLDEMKKFLTLSYNKKSYPTAPDKKKKNIYTIPNWHTDCRNEDFKARRGYKEQEKPK